MRERKDESLVRADYVVLGDESMSQEAILVRGVGVCPNLPSCPILIRWQLCNVTTPAGCNYRVEYVDKDKGISDKGPD